MILYRAQCNWLCQSCYDLYEQCIGLLQNRMAYKSIPFCWYHNGYKISIVGNPWEHILAHYYFFYMTGIYCILDVTKVPS